MTANEQDFELTYWNSPGAMYFEEMKQYVYAELMGIERRHLGFAVHGKNIVDIGGGPCSMLLKCGDRGPKCVVVDPLTYRFPSWVLGRYNDAHIAALPFRGETFGSEHFGTVFDEAWIYNVLQHTDDPAAIIRNALGISRVLRIFDWIDMPAHEGHPQVLTKPMLDDWLGSSGTVHELNHGGCVGTAYVAVVEGKAK